MLAVDDSREDLELLRRCLARIEDVEATVESYLTVDECLLELHEQEFDVVILDLRIAGKSGLDLLASLRERGVGAPGILVTGQGDEEVAVAAMHAGFADYISKGAIGTRSLRRAILNAVEKHHLKARLVAKNFELEQMVLDLRARTEEIEGFYHCLAHELKTPLTSIREFVSIVMDGLQGPINPGQHELLSVALSSCDHMVRCIHDLLDSNRLETGKLGVERRLQPLAKTLGDAVSQHRVRAASKGVRLVYKAPDDGLNAWFDEDRIAQVVSNLLCNAVKFTDSGGRITLRTRLVPGSDGQVEIEVSDTGRGIAPRDLPRIFDRLYQSADGDAAVQGGLGLGLNLCRELVKLHGGQIEVESEVGRGSNFRFCLPTHQPQPTDTERLVA
ncbi:ATP-binding protein [Engelhardtia mirabilis]|uniref:hybrid sensor histidine kinase/response regulator n=1 Tax=Engelhardtia mirabilis TaxID=2528011 RepID=UPI003AF3F3CB